MKQAGEQGNERRTANGADWQIGYEERATAAFQGLMEMWVICSLCCN